MASTPRGRTPTPEEAAMLDVYRNAEAALLGTVAEEVRNVVDAPDGDTDAQRVVGARRVREAAEGAFLGLERGKRAAVDAVIGAAYDQGAAEGARQLGGITGRGRDQYGDPGINRGALDRLAASVLDRITPAHAAILRVVPDAFRTVIERVAPALVVGAHTRREAAQRALWALTDRGITGFTDVAGRRWALSTYVEMATRTAAARAHVDGQLDRLSDAGRDLVIVSNSAGECDKCRPWERRILTIGGAGAGQVRVEHALNDGEYLDVDVAGSVDDARRAGLLHPQCRHSLSAYLPGVTKVDTGPTEDPEGDKARQRQRELERQIRAWKAREAAALDESSRRRARAGRAAANGRMNDHMRANPDLRRLKHRESPGAGNLPTPGLRARVGDEGPAPQRTTGKARPARQQSDAELSRNMTAALGREDFDEFERFAAESDRREASRAGARDRRQDAAAARDEQRAAEYGQLLDKGWNDEDAVAEVYGVSVEKQRRQRAIESLRGSGYTGRSFDELARQSYRDHVAERFIDAEAATNGYLLNPAGKRAGIDAASLFTGPDARARKYASPELAEWWDRNGRVTLDEWKAELQGDSQAASRARNERGDYYT